MPKEATRARGIFERPAGSGCWWINYYVGGKQHREKVGRKSDAIALYQSRKTDARRKVKLPELVPGKVVTFAHLMEDAVAYAKTHLATVADYEWKQRTLAAPFGVRPAAEIKPQEIDQWLTDNCNTPATANRFKSFFSLSFRLGVENGKVEANPARLVRTRKECNARLRFLSRKEYATLLEIISTQYPKQRTAFIVSVYTGMRYGEQFDLVWSQVDLARKNIRLLKTKNGEARNVPLNSIALRPSRSSTMLYPTGHPIWYFLSLAA